ncbi:MAG: AMP-binding protein, partial [Pseudomonadota bacterium]
MADTIADLLAPHPDDAPTLGAPGRAWMSFGALRAQNAAVRAGLAAAGIGAADRVAIVLPNGPEMAAAFLSVATACCAAPLNPAYKEDEFDFYLSDLGAKAIILAEGEAGPAAAAALKRGLRVVRLSPAAEGPAGA